MPAFGCVEDFVRKVAVEQKQLTAAFLDRDIQAVIAIKTGEDPSLAKLLSAVIACFFPRLPSGVKGLLS